MSAVAFLGEGFASVADGEVEVLEGRDVGLDPREPDEQMGGLPVTRVSSPNGVWAYTLYTNAEHPFVHALDTRRGVAFCIDLPWRGGQALDTVRMHVTSGGRSLVLRQPVVGRLALVDTRTFAVRAVAAPVA